MLEVSWVFFIAASLILIVTPGQDMMLVMSRSIAQGPHAGIITAAGVSVGLVGHTVLATLGLGAILRTSQWLFLALKLVGAVYLVYLGLQLLRTQRGALRSQAARRARCAGCSSTERFPTSPIPRSPSSISPSCPSSSVPEQVILRSRSSLSGWCSRD